MRFFLLLMGLGWIALTPFASRKCTAPGAAAGCVGPLPTATSAQPLHQACEILLPPKPVAIDDSGLQRQIGPSQAAD